MSVFGNYARYYDLLYSEKNYNAEANYIHDLIKKAGKKSTTILELGCGTGKHALALSRKGYRITGVDLSQEMLDCAFRQSKTNSSHCISFIKGDIRDVRLEKKFDVVISLFHVISYQISNDDLFKSVNTAQTHLKPGGLFIFDCWYGPSVLTHLPEIRVKRMENKEIRVIRIAEPVLYPNTNVVDVNYTINIKDKRSSVSEELKETHKMRYLFQPEIEMLFEFSKFKFVFGREWLKNNEPGFDSWGAVFCGKKV